jgi:BON domain
MDDRRLKQEVLDELDFDPSIDAANIGVSVDDGIVTLTGHVSSYVEKSAAEQAARRVKGVRALAYDGRCKVAGLLRSVFGRRSVAVLRSVSCGNTVLRATRGGNVSPAMLLPAEIPS